jgi:glycosidase
MMVDVEWFKNAVIYHILIDRFAGFKSTKDWDKPIFLGGNIRGITKKLPYLKNIGIDTIWISPFYKTDTYHGYHITDFFEVEPHFGTQDDLKKLINAVHEKDMHIITDFVPNHCSKNHPYFIDAQNNPNSEYKKWFYFKKHSKDYLCFLSVKDLPKINLNNRNARNYMINAAKHWLSLGFDGYRLDHVIGPNHDFWKQFKYEIKKMFPNTVLIGEAWMKGIKLNELKTINIKHKFLKWLFGASSDKLLKEYTELLDGVLDFRLQELLRTYIVRKDIQQTRQILLTEIKRHYNKYPDNYFLPTFLDNHDMNRFLFECKNNKEKLKTAAKIQFSINQPPIVYYGTEVGMTQEKSIWSFPAYGDLQARQPMNWKKQDKELSSFYKEIIAKRKNTFNI